MEIKIDKIEKTAEWASSKTYSGAYDVTYKNITKDVRVEQGVACGGIENEDVINSALHVVFDKKILKYELEDEFKEKHELENSVDNGNVYAQNGMLHIKFEITIGLGSPIVSIRDFKKTNISLEDDVSLIRLIIPQEDYDRDRIYKDDDNIRFENWKDKTFKNFRRSSFSFYRSDRPGLIIAYYRFYKEN
jgi:hypothetical protein